MVAAKALLAGVVALLWTGAALADNPTVHLTETDQAKAAASLLRLHDFGMGWSGGAKAAGKLTAPRCPGFDPKESDLVVSGHAAAHFAYGRGAVTLDQDTQVLETPEAVRTDFARTIKPKLAECLAYQLKQAGKGQVVSAEVRRLPFPALGTVSAAYRATLVLRAGSRLVKFVNDFVFVGEGRLEYSLSIVAPAVESAQLVPFEQSLVQILVRRAGANVA